MRANALRAEWTRFRTSRGLVMATVTAVLITVLLGLLFASGDRTSCGSGTEDDECPALPLGPHGEAVRDKFFFVHQPLTANGSITVRVTSMTGVITYPPPNHDKILRGVVPWAKAGVMIKDGTRQGSDYAAMLLTGSHGVRMQHSFTEDTAGRPGRVSAASPRWLRLTRSGDRLAGYESADGRRWTKVGTARLAGLPATVRVGLFASSPGDLTKGQGGQDSRFTQATAVFDQVSLSGTTPGGAWGRNYVGATGVNTDWERHHRAPGGVESGGTFTVTGSGDVAPLGIEGDKTIERPLVGVAGGLIVVVIAAVLFARGRHSVSGRRSVRGDSLQPGRVLAAKAVVIGTVTFAAGLAAAGVLVPVGTRILRANGYHVLPVTTLTELRVIVGTAALLAVASVLALAIGALIRRAAVAIVIAISAIVVPYLLATTSVLPDGPSQWLLRLTPAAAFAIQQSIPAYSHVPGDYVPHAGYYPLAPWAGFAMLCGYAALALVLARTRSGETGERG